MFADKYQNVTDNIKQLFEWGDPRKREDSILYGEWNDYLPHGFTEADESVLIDLINDKDYLESDSDSDAIWVPLYAWRILGQLQIEAAVDPLIKMLDESVDDDWVTDEVPLVLAMIGKSAMAKLSHILQDNKEQESNRVAASKGLAEMVGQHPELRDEILAHFRSYLLKPAKEEERLNGLLVSDLMGCKAQELINEIRGLFRVDCLDQGITGDLEDVEIALGLRAKRSNARPKSTKARKEPLEKVFVKDEDDETEWEKPQRRAVDAPFVRDTTPKLGRNAPCACGSGKPYKACCLSK